MAVTNFVWDEASDNVLMELDGAGTTVAEYTHQPDKFGGIISQQRAGDTSFYQFDGDASTRQLTDESQTVTDTATYTGYGEVVAESGTTTNPFRYKGAAGYYTEEKTGSIYVRRRDYSPRQGRWLAEDPMRFTDGTNRFAYVGNNPVCFVDAAGLACVITSPDPPNKAGWWEAAIEVSAYSKACGLTDGTFKISCQCCCGSRGTWWIQCTVRVRMKIYLDIDTIKEYLRNAESVEKDREKWGRIMNIENCYGHEQRHVVNLVNCVKGKFLSDLTNDECLESGQATSLDDCRKRARALELKYHKQFCKDCLAIERVHGRPHPEDGRPYPPLPCGLGPKLGTLPKIEDVIEFGCPEIEDPIPPPVDIDVDIPDMPDVPDIQQDETKRNCE